MSKKAKKRRPPKKKVRKRPAKRFVERKALKKRVRRVVEEKPLSDSAVQQFRELLMQKRDDLFALVQRKKEQEFQIEEPEIGDEADIATRSVEKEILFELTDSEKKTLDSIEAAIRKIEKGVFGRCESCQKTIPHLRLEVMPWARYCIPCQSMNEVPSSE